MDGSSEITIRNNAEIEQNSIGNNCRICIKKSTDIWQVFQKYEEISTKIMACTSVQVREGDGLPSVICHNCRQLLEVSYNFKCLVEKSDAKLRQILRTKRLIHINPVKQSFLNSDDTSTTGTIAVNLHLNQKNHLRSDIGNQNYRESYFTRKENINVDNAANEASLDELRKYSIKIDRKKDDSSVKIEGISITEDIIDSSQHLEDSLDQSETMVFRFHEAKRNSEKEGENDEDKPLSDRTCRFKCPDCVRFFRFKPALRSHRVTLRTNTKYRRVCYMCNERFFNISMSEDHLTTHTSVNSNGKQFEVIKKSLDTILDYDRGKFDETSNEIGGTLRMIDRNSKIEPGKFKYSCEFCSKKFTYEKSFFSHAKKHSECQKEVKSEDQMKIGSEDKRRVESEDDEMPLESLHSTKCGKVFTTKKNLQRHLSTHTGLKFNCTTRDHAFPRLDNDDHDNQVEASKIEKEEKPNRPHSCPVCPKAFAHTQSLTNHLERHQRAKGLQKRFLCEICSKCFAQSGSLVAHMRTHTGVKPYVCNVCSRAFTKSTYLQLHLRTHSGDKPYICQYCSRAFARANTLARHITMHTGEAKYHCLICRKSFRRLTSLNEHTYTHTGQRPYACKICTKRYNNAGSLYAHTKKCRVQSNMTSIAANPTETTALQNSSNSPLVIIDLPRKLSEGEVIDQAIKCDFNMANVHSVDNLRTIVGPSMNYESMTTDVTNSYYIMYSEL